MAGGKFFSYYTRSLPWFALDGSAQLFLGSIEEHETKETLRRYGITT